MCSRFLTPPRRSTGLSSSSRRVDWGGPALHTLINEISLIVDYTTGGTPPAGVGDLTKLVTGGGFITGTATYSDVRGNFGFNARSSTTGTDAPGTGNFEYNDGKLQVKGRVNQIDTCAAGGSFTFSGDYTGRDGKGPKTLSSTFSATVVDHGEPGKGVDTIALTLTPNMAGFDGFSTQILTGGNIQYHFCDL